MKISVIIPVFNGEKYIAQCIENLLYQTYKDLEIIVVNDGSTDKTVEIAQKYPVKLVTKENGGVASARNVGIDSATGEYIHFMDNDDLISLNFYEKMLDVATHTNADMVCCEVIHERLPALSLKFNNITIVSTNEDKIQMTNVRNQGACWKYLFRTCLIQEHNLRFAEEFIWAEDLYFSFQAIYFANKIATVPNAVYHYKYRRQSLMTFKTKDNRRQRKDFARKAGLLCENFAKQHQININNTRYKVYRYRVFGLLVLKKRVYSTGRVRWYLLGLGFMQRTVR